MSFYRRPPKNWCIRCPINNVFLAVPDEGYRWCHTPKKEGALWYETRKEAQYVLDQLKVEDHLDFQFRIEEWSND